MTHYQLQQALKTLRDQGYDVKVKLNAKTFLLQAEYDRLQQEITAVEAVEVPAEYPKGVDPYTGFSTSYEPPMDEYEQYRVNLLENCVNVEYYSNGVVRDVNTDTLYCELPTPRNIAAEYIADNAPDYWANWDATYTTAIESLKPVKPPLIATPAPIPTSVNHGVVGVALIVMMLEAWRVVAFLLIPLIVQSFYTIRKTAIYTTLVVDGFKQAVTLARKTLQIA
jgi:hypothetical protein